MNIKYQCNISLSVALFKKKGEKLRGGNKKCMDEMNEGNTTFIFVSTLSTLLPFLLLNSTRKCPLFYLKNLLRTAVTAKSSPNINKASITLHSYTPTFFI